MDILPIDGFDECCIYDRAGAGLANGMKVVSMATTGPSVTTMRAKIKIKKRESARQL